MLSTLASIFTAFGIVGGVFSFLVFIADLTPYMSLILLVIFLTAALGVAMKETH